jgi:predicted small secreted protein
MKDLYQRLYEDAMAKAQEHNIPRGRITRVFLEAYEEHKHIHGSFKHSSKYQEDMSARYHFMHQKAIQYIKSAEEIK